LNYLLFVCHSAGVVDIFFETILFLSTENKPKMLNRGSQDYKTFDRVTTNKKGTKNRKLWFGILAILLVVLSGTALYWNGSAKPRNIDVQLSRHSAKLHNKVEISAASLASANNILERIDPLAGLGTVASTVIDDAEVIAKETGSKLRAAATNIIEVLEDVGKNVSFVETVIKKAENLTSSARERVSTAVDEAKGARGIVTTIIERAKTVSDEVGRIASSLRNKTLQVNY